MAIDKEIRLTVDDSPLNKLRQQTEQIARDMIRSSRQFSTSGADVIKDIQEQIKLLERRNTIQEQYDRNRLQSARQAGTITPQQYAQQIQGVSGRAGGDKLQIELLREIIESIRQTSKNEIREDRANVERNLRQSRTVGRLGPAGDEYRNLMETMQAEYLQPGEQPGPGRQGAADRAFSRRNRIRRRVEQTLNKAASAENEYSFLAHAFEGIPIAGPALATVTQRGIGAAGEYERAAIGYGRQERFGLGGNVLNRGKQYGSDIGFSLNALGLTPAEALTKSTQYQAALQRSVGPGAGQNLMGAERTLGLDQNIIMQLLSTARYDKSVQDPTSIINKFDAYLQNNGKMVSMMPELINTFEIAAGDILSVRGTLNTQGLAGTIAGFARQTGFEGTRLNRLTTGVSQLGRSQNPVVRAMMMQSFRETSPSASFLDIQEMMEGGLSEQSLPGLQRFFENMQERTGGGDALTFALQQALPNMSLADIREVTKGGGFASIFKKYEGEAGMDYVQQSIEGKFVGPVEKSGKQIESALAMVGEGFIEIVETIKEKINSALEVIGSDISLGGKEMTEAEKENKKMRDDIYGAESGYRGGW